MNSAWVNYIDSQSPRDRQQIIDLINNASSLEQLPIPLQIALKSNDALARAKLETLIGKEIPRGVNQTLYQQRLLKEKDRVKIQLDKLIESQNQAVPVQLDQVKLLQFYRKNRPDLIEKLEVGNFADPELNHLLGPFGLNSLRQTIQITNLIEKLGPVNDRLLRITETSLESELILSAFDKKFMRFVFPTPEALKTYLDWFSENQRTDPLAWIFFKADPGQLRKLHKGLKIGRNEIDLTMRILPRLSHYWQEFDSLQKQPTQSQLIDMSKRPSETVSNPTESLRMRNLKKTLQHDGYAVVENVLSPEQCAAYIDAMWTWIEGFDTGINRRYPLTWTTKNWPFTTHGLLQHFKVGQSEFAWKMRVEPEILKIFSNLWNCPPEDLIVSFDGVNMGRATKRQGTWIHLDQGPRSSELRHYQGCVTLTTTDGGLVFYDKSPALHAKFWREHKKMDKGDDWYKFNPEDEEWYKRQGSSKVFVPSQAGSLVLWDSRVPHQGQLPTQPGQIRMCIYVCYKPRSSATPAILKKRIKSFTERRMTNHMPDNPKLFSNTFRTWGNEELLTKFPNQPTISDDQVTPLMRRLIGF